MFFVFISTLDSHYNLKVYPNPSSALFSVQVFIPNTEKSTIEIFDILGRSVKKIAIEKSIGIKTIKLDLSKVASGEYQLVFKNSNKIVEKKLIKQ